MIQVDVELTNWSLKNITPSWDVKSREWTSSLQTLDSPHADNEPAVNCPVSLPSLSCWTDVDHNSNMNCSSERWMDKTVDGGVSCIPSAGGPLKGMRWQTDRGTSGMLIMQRSAYYCKTLAQILLCLLQRNSCACSPNYSSVLIWKGRANSLCSLTNLFLQSFHFWRKDGQPTDAQFQPTPKERLKKNMAVYSRCWQS